MAGSKVAVLEAIRERLQAAITGDGNDLSEVKRLKVGSSEEVHGGEANMPYINLNLLAGTEEANSPNNRYNDDMNIEVVIVCSKLGDHYNNLYKVSDQTGPLYLLETVLNVLDLNTDGDIDNTFGGSVEYIKAFSYTPEYSKECVVFRININLKTKAFIAGGR